MADPDKIEPRFSSEGMEKTKVKETTSSPVSDLAKATRANAESLESFASLLQKITDLSEAKKGILLAKDLYAKGETGEAKEMTMRIFKRLQQIGKAPEGLDIQKVEEHLTAGTYDKLAESLHNIGGAKTPKQGEIIGDLKGVKRLVSKPAEEKDPEKLAAVKKHNDENEAKRVKLKDKIDVEVKDQRPVVDKEEEDVQKEFAALLKMIEKKATIAEKVELQDVREIIESGTVGEVDTRAQIEKLKTKIITKVKEKIDGGDLAAVKDKAELARRRKAGDSAGVIEGIAERVRQSAVGERTLILRLNKLENGMKKVDEGVKKGVGLQESVRSLGVDEIREVRKLLSSLKEQKDVSDRSPYYDEAYVDFVKGLGLNEDEALGLEKMLESVDVNYQKASLVKEPAVRPETVNQRTMAGRSRPESRQPGSMPDFEDHDLIRDANDSPVQGMSHGLMDEQIAKQLHEGGHDRFFDDLYTLKDGTLYEIPLADQMENAKRKSARRMSLDRNEQRESFQNINMNELFEHMEKYDKPLTDKDGKEIVGVDGKPLTDEDGKPLTIRTMIDDDFYEKHQVAKLKDKFLNPADNTPEKKAKEAFETWWYQEVSFEQRKLAYEGLFEKRSQSPRMQRLNSLMEIIGVATSKKGLANWMAMSYNMIDMQNNSYVNAEFMQKLAGFWTNQGVDFRLENMLKQYRENISMTDPKSGLRETLKDSDKKDVTINVFDTLNFMQEYVPDDADLRTKLGIPEWWKGKWGTFIYKYSAEDVRGEARKGAWEYFLKKKKKVVFDENFKPEQRTEISNRYQLMFDLSFNYAVAHKQLYQMLGNASFREGEFELPAACAEMHLKLDTVLYSKLFVPRYTWLNAAFKEGWALFDPGVRDYITMAPQDYASHFVESGLVKKIVDLGNGEQEVTLYLAGETENGSPTVLKTFFGEKFGKTELNRDLLTYRTKVGIVKDEDAVNKLIGEKGEIGAIGERVKRVIELKKTFDGVLWHHGKVNEKGRKEALDFMMEWGVNGDQKSAYRNSSGVVGDKLKAALYEDKKNGEDDLPLLEAIKFINWEEYYKIAQDPSLEKEMRAAEGDKVKQWEIFAETFGEHSFNHSTPSAKRSGDHPVKYGVEAFNKYVETFMAWIQEPYNPEKFDALMDVPTAVNAGIVPGLSKKNLEFLMLMNEKMGFRYLGGGTMKRLWRDPENATTKFDTTEGAFEDNKSEWPSYKTELISNKKAPWNPIQHKSIPESVGIGIPQDKQVMFDLIRGQRAKGRLPDTLYSDFYKKINKSTLYEAKLGLPINIYRWLTFEPIFEAIAPLLGVTSYELRKVLSETTSKTASGFLKYLNS